MITNHQTMREQAEACLTPFAVHTQIHPADILALLDEVEALRVDAYRWRQARDNHGDGLRLIKWNHSAIEELQVLFPSPILCDEYANKAIDAARHAQGDEA